MEGNELSFGAKGDEGGNDERKKKKQKKIRGTTARQKVAVIWGGVIIRGKGEGSGGRGQEKKKTKVIFDKRMWDRGHKRSMSVR